MKANYYNIWRTFNEFFIRLDVKPDKWKDRLTLFVGYLIDKNRKSTTIHSYVSAIKAVLSSIDEEIDEDQVLLSALIRACKIHKDRVITCLPIRKSLLHLILDAIETRLFSMRQPYLTALFKALFATAYFGLFRIGELAASDHVLKAKDIHVGLNKKKMMFILHSSKTHRKNAKLQIIKIDSINRNPGHFNGPRIHTDRYCPFKLLNDYIQCRGQYKKQQDQFFVFHDGSPVLPSHFRWIMKKFIKYNKPKPFGLL